MMLRMLVIVTIIVVAKFELNGPDPDGANNKMRYLGDVDGKGYFTDRTAFRNWTTAKTYCESVGLQLATVKTENEATFLMSKYEHDYLMGEHWIGARDSQQLRALVWDKSNTEPVNLTSTIWTHRVTEHKICGVFSFATPSFMEMKPCQNMHQTMCETTAV